MGRGRYLCRKHETLDSWYYEKEWEDIGWVKVWDAGMNMYRLYPEEDCPHSRELQEPLEKQDSEIWKHFKIVIDPNWKPPKRESRKVMLKKNWPGGESAFDKGMADWELRKFRMLNHIGAYC